MKETRLSRKEFNLLVNDILLDIKPIKLRISIANRLVEFFDKKQEQIAELEEQLKNAIVPKFKPYNDLFVIVGNNGKHKIEQYYIDEIVLRNNGSLVCYRDKCKSILITEKNELFATKEEALEKLRELKGK